MKSTIETYNLQAHNQMKKKNIKKIFTHIHPPITMMTVIFSGTSTHLHGSCASYELVFTPLRSLFTVN